MYPILETKACQLHLHQIGDGNDGNTVTIAGWLRKSGYRFSVFFAYFFSREHQMNGAVCLRLFGVDEHVHTRRMTVPKSKRTSSFDNRLQVSAIDRDIDVARQS